MAWYSTGTVAVTNGSNAVTADGSQFIGNVKSGDIFAVVNDGHIYEIDQVISATQLTLRRPYAGAGGPGLGYDIIPSATFLKTLARQVADLISLYQAVPQTATDAANSAAAAATSAAASQASKNLAATSENNAAASAAAAASSASSALASKNAVSTSEANAASSKAAASSSAASAANSAASAANSATAAAVAVNGYLPLTGGTLSSALAVNGMDSGGAQFRAIYGSYGVMLRNDGTNTYLLSTPKDAPTGQWNTHRPFAWDLANGHVTIDGAGAGATFGGVVSAIAGSLTIRASNGRGAGQVSIGILREGAPADQKIWELLQDGQGAYVCRTVNDAYTIAQPAYQINRGAGYNLTYMALMPTPGCRVTVGAGSDDGTTTLQVYGNAKVAGKLAVGPFSVGLYTLSTLPSASAYANCLITVTNATGGAKVCISNGTNWCLLNTSTVVS